MSDTNASRVGMFLILSGMMFTRCTWITPVIPSPATGTAVAGKEKDVAGQMDRMQDQFEPSHATCKSKNPE